MASETKLPPDPEQMNDARASWADIAIYAFRDKTRCEPEETLGDLLCDLMHWADRNGEDFAGRLEGALQNYEAETAPEPSPLYISRGPEEQAEG
jgi:hypothetical protein